MPRSLGGLEIQDPLPPPLSQLQGTHRPLSKVNPHLLEVEAVAQLAAQCAPILFAKTPSARGAQPVFTVRNRPSSASIVSRIPVPLHLVRPRLAWKPEAS